MALETEVFFRLVEKMIINASVWIVTFDATAPLNRIGVGNIMLVWKRATLTRMTLSAGSGQIVTEKSIKTLVHTMAT